MDRIRRYVDWIARLVIVWAREERREETLLGVLQPVCGAAAVVSCDYRGGAGREASIKQGHP